jgi:glycosyltransferase involved in cell wall biosynthesis
VAQVVANHVSRALRIPYVATWHGFFRPKLSRTLWPCTGHRTIAISRPVYDHLVRQFRVPSDRVRLIMNGVDVQYFSERPDPDAVRAYGQQAGIPPGVPVIGMISRLSSADKGFDVLLKATNQLLGQVPELRVLLVGSGPHRIVIERAIRALGLLNRVHVLPGVTDVRVPLALMDAFVFPVRGREGFGLTLVEAMAAGKPVIASRMGAVPDIVEHGKSGWLVAPDRPQALAEGILHLLRNPAEAAQMGYAAKRRVDHSFHIARVADQVAGVYGEVAA